MHTVTEIMPAKEGVSPEVGVDSCKPLARQKKSTFQLIREVLDHGGPGYLQFAITNICNAKCDFCGFAVDRFDPKQRRSVTLQEARDVMDIAASRTISATCSSSAASRWCTRTCAPWCATAPSRGIHPMICTNGSLWTEQNMRDLASDGLSSVIMSIDSHEVAKHEKNRGLPDVCRKIQHANEVFGQLGVQTTASVTASKLIDDYAKLPDFLRDARIPKLHFQLSAHVALVELPELQRLRPGELLERGADRGLRKDQADEGTAAAFRWSIRRNRSPRCSGICARNRRNSAAWAATSISTSIGTSTSTAATSGKRPCATSTSSIPRSSSATAAPGA